VASSEGANQKGKRIPAETPPMHGLDGPARGVLACEGSEANRLAGPKDEWAARSAGLKAKKGIFELKIGFLNLPRLWKFVEGDLGGILT
jgi:hypothetical protein